jgi:hypothetical protein
MRVTFCQIGPDYALKTAYNLLASIVARGRAEGATEDRRRGERCGSHDEKSRFSAPDCGRHSRGRRARRRAGSRACGGDCAGHDHRRVTRSPADDVAEPRSGAAATAATTRAEAHCGAATASARAAATRAAAARAAAAS